MAFGRCVLVTVGAMLAGVVVACSSYDSGDTTGKVNTPNGQQDAGSDADASSSSCTNGTAGATLELGKSLTGLCQTNSYVFTAPNDVGGGWVAIAITNRKGSHFDYSVISESDKSKLLALSDNQNTDGAVNGFLGVRAGAKYRMQIDTDETSTYDLVVTYTKFPDDNEPNDTRQTAKAIALDTDVKGVAGGGLDAKSTMKDEDYDDFFALDLKAGTVTATLKNPDPKMTLQVMLYDETGKTLEVESSPTLGADVALVENTAVTAGKYFVAVRAVGYTFSTELAGSQETRPESFVTPYVLRVTQP